MLGMANKTLHTKHIQTGGKTNVYDDKDDDDDGVLGLAWYASYSTEL